MKAIREYKEKRISFFITGMGVVVAFFAFFPSFTHLFRSDQWYVAHFAFTYPLSWQTILKSLHFELFGDARFQPLAYCLLFLVHKLFGVHFLLYHILAFFIHIANGILIVLLLHRVLHWKIIAGMIGVCFMVMSLHADTVMWTHFIYISVQLTCLLGSCFLFFIALEQQKKYLLFFSFFCLLLASLFYEAILLISIFITPLFFWRSIVDQRHKCRELFPWFVRAAAVFYVLLTSIVLLFFKTVSGTSKVLSHDFGKRFLYGLKHPFLMIRNTLVELYTPASKIGFADIPYIVLNNVTIVSTLVFAGFVLYFFICLKRYFKNRNGLFVLFLYASLAAYLFTISFSRMSLYVVTQPRYLYFMNAIILMIVAFFINDLRMRLYPVRYFRFIFPATVTCWFLFFAGTNTYHTVLTARTIQDLLQPLRAEYLRLNDFVQSDTYTGGKIFIAEQPRTQEEQFFLGMHIFLETLFSDRDIFTRYVQKASYIYQPGKEIYPNQTYEQNAAQADDFTIEFDWHIFHLDDNDNKVVIVDSDKCKIFLLFKKHQPFLLLAGKWITEPKEKVTLFTVPLWRVSDSPLFNRFASHIIVQREGKKLYVLQDGRLLATKDVGRARLEIDDQSLFLGTSIYLPFQTKGFYLENFYACIGKTKYDFSQSHVTLFEDKHMFSPVTSLGSHMVYYSKSFRYWSIKYVKRFE